MCVRGAAALVFYTKMQMHNRFYQSSKDSCLVSLLHSPLLMITGSNPCSHDTIAGQELCYFCHQRSKKNVYVDISAEKKARDLQYERILQEYQDKKHSLASAKEHEAKRVSKSFAKDTSSLNFKSFVQKVSTNLF